MHGLRPTRSNGLDRATRTPPVPPVARTRRTRRLGDLVRHAADHRVGAASGRHRRDPGGSSRDHQSTRNDSGVESPHRNPGAPGDRLARHPNPRNSAEHRARDLRLGHPASHRTTPGDILFRTQASMAVRQSPAATSAGRLRRPAVRNYGHMDRLEPHRRRAQFRGPRHRPHQRQPDDADGAGHCSPGTTSFSPPCACRGRCCRRSDPPSVS